MLQYREFLLQSRANRLSSEFATHSRLSHQTHADQHSHQSPHSHNSRHAPHEHHPRASSHKSHESIKQLVSQPNYGQIFYSDSGKKVVKGAPESKTVIKGKESEKNKKKHNEELSVYLEQLEAENNALKQRLSQQQRNSARGNPQNKGKSSKVRKPSRFEQQNNERLQSHDEQGLEAHAQSDPIYVQQDFHNNHNHYQNQNESQNRYHYNPHPNYDNHHHHHHHHHHEQQPQYYHQPQFGTAKHPISVLTLAKQKLSELKDDDEELRQYSLQVLRRPIS